MQLRSLELFCSVAQQRSFSRAAETHAVTQSAVSQAVLHIEEVLGARLVDRSKRPLNLTDAGAVFHQGLRKILGDYRALEQEVRCLGSRLQGRVRVAAIYSVAASYMPEATAAFQQMHPDVEIRIEPATPTRVVELASSGEADFGLISYARGTRAVRSTHWQKEPMRLICAPEHPMATAGDVELNSLNKLPMIGFETSLKVRREIDQFFSHHGVRPNYQFEYDNLDSMIRAIQANQGIGILPEAAVRRETAAGSLRVVACPELSLQRPLGIIRRRSGKLSPAAREFAEMLLGKPIEPPRTASSSANSAAYAKPDAEGKLPRTASNGAAAKAKGNATSQANSNTHSKPKPKSKSVHIPR
ncbi:LysR family transcriptional regulator [Roseimaritima ulvae]|uniref:HTH-type transcriptional activator CmpR n=1 Tax=Roseimaritima ulvae TaxID=980254 RepID=A0A5B9QSM5_9BACT|nr:LysR family transcriptional regulator [Roseimaritima ulvae]QEG40730.1 HTH-type transcriptional activator CmpR [Roseimaritima ulvae]